METKQITVYLYDELSERAKDKARDWYANGMDIDLDFAIDDIKRMASLFGLTINDLSYSVGGYGDYCMIKGEYVYKKGALKAIKSEAPQDIDLLEIVSALQNLQKRHFYSLSSTLAPSGLRNGLTHVTSGDYRLFDMSDATEEALQEIFRAFSNWAESRLTSDYEYQTSQESIEESIRANEYTFLENGTRF